MYWCGCHSGVSWRNRRTILETYNFINNLEVSYLHVFTYSERSNTLAAEMEGVVPIQERKRRNKMMRILSEKEACVL